MEMEKEKNKLLKEEEEKYKTEENEAKRLLPNSIGLGTGFNIFAINSSLIVTDTSNSFKKGFVASRMSSADRK